MAPNKHKSRKQSWRPHKDARKPEITGKMGHRSGKPEAFWLYGFHAARAALANPHRVVTKILATARAMEELGAAIPSDLFVEPVESEAISKLLPSGAVHQGIALFCQPISSTSLEETLESLPSGRRLVAVLDQITDPHNEGAILRTAAAFGVDAVIVQTRHAPPESGALAKAASGALDIVPRISVINIARALEDLGRMNFWRIALAGDAEHSLQDTAREGDIAIVVGAEGSGVRRLVRETCDVSAAIPMSDAMESLNVSNAAAIALYELRKFVK